MRGIYPGGRAANRARAPAAGPAEYGDQVRLVPLMLVVLSVVSVTCSAPARCVPRHEGPSGSQGIRVED